MVASRYARHNGALCLVLAPKLARALGAETGDIVRLEDLGDGTWRLIPAGPPQPESWAQQAIRRYHNALRRLAKL